MVLFCVLGPVEVLRSDSSASLGGAKQQTLLAYLLLHANRYVPFPELIEALWGDTPPASARKNIQLYASRLRRLLARNSETVQLVTKGNGYLLSLEPGQLDLDHCRDLQRRGRESLECGAPGQASDLLRRAITMWRGHPLDGVAHTLAMQAEAACLEELRMTLQVEYFRAQLAADRHLDAVPELTRLVARFPYEERLRSQLMVALWACGRRHKALEVYRAGYRHLRDGLGVAPGGALQAIYQRILLDDPDRRSKVHDMWVTSPWSRTAAEPT